MLAAPISQVKKTNFVQIFPRIACFVVLAASIVVFCGWIFDIPLLKSIHPHFSPMKPNTAIAFYLTSVSFWMGSSFPVQRFKQNLSIVFAVLTLLISGLTLIEYVFHVNLGIDFYFFKEVVLSSDDLYPGRIGFNACINFILSALAIVFLNMAPVNSKLFLVSLFLTISTLVMVVFSLISDAYSNFLFYKPNVMSFYTTIIFLVLDAGVLCAWLVKWNAAKSKPAAEIFGEKRNDKKTLEKTIGVSFGIGLLILMVMGVISGRSISRMLQSSSEVTHVHQTLSGLDLILIDLLNIETGHRGYLIKGEEKYLEPYQAGLTTIDEQMKSLKLLMKEKNQIQEFTVLKSLIDVKIQEVQRRTEVRKKNGFEAAVNEIEQGKYTMDEIRRQIAQMKEAGYSLLTKNKQISEYRAKQALQVLSYGNFFAFLLVALASFFINRDIDRRRRAEQELSSKNQQIEMANKELEAFSYSVSHDLRAPLRHINGFVDLLFKRSGSTLDDKNKQYLNTIADSAKQMGRLIDDLLVFSRMGRTELRYNKVKFSVLVKEVIDEVKQDVKNRMIDWQVELLPDGEGDLSMLRQVFINLISNAVKYTGPREKARIEVGCLYPTKEEVVFFVRDNGVGFDAQYASKLFGVFQRLHKSEEFEGTGIGLANVRRIIARHGGRTWAESPKTGGAIFYFSLPT